MSYPFDDDPMTDEEYQDLVQASQEELSGEEIDRMFAWWEREVARDGI